MIGSDPTRDRSRDYKPVARLQFPNTRHPTKRDEDARSQKEGKKKYVHYGDRSQPPPSSPDPSERDGERADDVGIDEDGVQTDVLLERRRWDACVVA
ncbi:hypothetical protein QE152_g899 [Popillia japonica]|uniref:Uncharacterized protein n=1 Tax=Popillia japonica TaxID=7064 RepID=A0AAW1N7G0_POPJA